MTSDDDSGIILSRFSVSRKYLPANWRFRQRTCHTGSRAGTAWDAEAHHQKTGGSGREPATLAHGLETLEPTKKRHMLRRHRVSLSVDDCANESLDWRRSRQPAPELLNTASSESIRQDLGIPYIDIQELTSKATRIQKTNSHSSDEDENTDLCVRFGRCSDSLADTTRSQAGDEPNDTGSDAAVSYRVENGINFSPRRRMSSRFSDSDGDEEGNARYRESGVVKSWSRELRRVSQHLPELFEGISPENFSASFIRSVAASLQLSGYSPLSALCAPMPWFVALAALVFGDAQTPQSNSPIYTALLPISTTHVHATRRFLRHDYAFTQESNWSDVGRNRTEEEPEHEEGPSRSDSDGTPSIGVYDPLSYNNATSEPRGARRSQEAALPPGKSRLELPELSSLDAVHVFATAFALTGVLSTVGTLLPAGMDLKGTDSVVVEERLHVVWKLLLRALYCETWYFGVLCGTLLALYRWTSVSEDILGFLLKTQDADIILVAQYTCAILLVHFAAMGAFECFNRFLCYHAYSNLQTVTFAVLTVLQCVATLVFRAAYAAGPFSIAAIASICSIWKAVILALFCWAYKYELGWQSGVRVKLYHRRRVGVRRSGMESSPGLPDFKRRAKRAGTSRPPVEAVRDKLLGDLRAKKYAGQMTGSSRRISNCSAESQGSCTTPRQQLLAAVVETEMKKQLIEDDFKTGGTDSMRSFERLDSGGGSGAVVVPLPQNTTANGQPLRSALRRDETSSENVLPPLLLARRSSRRFAKSPRFQSDDPATGGGISRGTIRSVETTLSSGAKTRRPMRGRTLVSVRSVPLDNHVILEALCLPKSRNLKLYFKQDLPRELKDLYGFLRIAIPSAVFLGMEQTVFLFAVLAVGVAGNNEMADKDVLARCLIALFGANLLNGPVLALSAAATEKGSFLLSISHTEGTKFVLQAVVTALGAYVATVLIFIGLLACPAILASEAGIPFASAFAMFFIGDSFSSLSFYALRSVEYLRISVIFATVAWVVSALVACSAVHFHGLPLDVTFFAVMAVGLFIVASIGGYIIYSVLGVSGSEPLLDSSSFCLTYLSVPIFRRGPADCRIFFCRGPDVLRIGSAKLEEVMLKMYQNDNDELRETTDGAL